VSRERTLPLAHSIQPEETDAAPGRWHWILAILILLGMILIGISVLSLLRESVPAHSSDACLWMARITR
jgi:hypothetical protein